MPAKERADGPAEWGGLPPGGPGEVIGRGRQAEVLAWGPGTVLKLYYKEGLDPQIVEAEARAARLLNRAGAPTPDAFGTVVLDGRPGIVFERVDGPLMLDVLLAKPWLARRLGWVMADLHATLHSIALPETVPAQRLSLERRVRAARELSDHEKEKVLALLARLPDGDRLCHSDMHPANILLGASGPVVIDWEEPRRGSPAADVARSMLILSTSTLHRPAWQRPAVGPLAWAFGRAYLRRYVSRTGLARGELRDWLRVQAAARLCEGIAEEREVLVRLARQV